MLAAISLVLPGSAADHAAWLAKLEGFYASQANPTPFGKIPFAMDLAREPDGSLHGRTWADSQTYFDFKFYLNDKSEIFFHETGSPPRPRPNFPRSSKRF
ncbi:MAG: hypothetical protein HY013_09110 [Candidatus Solibacter usitatus]|nr:hypothetical protein [Candidatus Solibacter usitatus]